MGVLFFFFGLFGGTFQPNSEMVSRGILDD